MEKENQNTVENGEINIVHDATEEVDTAKTETQSHRHSHHHHHHHHHHRSQKRSQKNFKKYLQQFLSFIQHNRKYLMHSAIAFVIIVALVFVGGRLDRRVRKSGDSSDVSSTVSQVAASENTMILRVPFFGSDVGIVGAAVEAYMQADISVSAGEIYRQFRQASDNRLDIGLPVTLSYEVSGLSGGYNVKKAEFLVADNQTMENPGVHTVPEGSTGVDVYYLKTGTQYYYRLRLTLSNGSITTVDGSFKTAAGPRVLSVEGVGNLRDVGGWKNTGGKTVRQGLLYRGCELDGAVNAKYTISPAGVNTMLSVLGIRTEMDLRSPNDNPDGTHALGAGVEHIYYNAPMYSYIFASENRGGMRQIFSDLADPGHYPIYLHCSHGMDRTGTVCYVLGALLGVSDEDLMRDYQLSSLYHGDAWYMDQMNEFVKKFQALEGLTMAEKAEGYLLSVGVTKAQIQSIRSIFLGEE